MKQPRKIHRIYISSNFEENSIECPPDLSRRITNVLRMKHNENIAVFNHKMEEYLSKVSISGNKVTIDLIEKLPSKADEIKRISLAVSIINMKLMDLIIQKSVELGVSEFYPIYTRRSQYKSVDKKCDHWKKIAIHATEQCGRLKLMEVSKPIEFTDFIENHNCKAKFTLHQKGDRFTPRELSNIDITFFVGPEGGFENSELELFKINKWKMKSINVNILRTETACISALTLLENYDAFSRYSLQ